MSNTLTNLFIFAAGAIIGSAVTWKLVKTKYERIAQEEINSVKEVFARDKENKEDIVKTGINETVDKAAIAKKEGYYYDVEDDDCNDDYDKAAAIAKKEGYYHDVEDDDCNDDYDDEETEERIMSTKPYVVSPEEFSEGEYSVMSLTLYADGVLADDFDEVIEDVEGTVGRDSLNHFGEYEDDSVFVRNDELELDYEILKDVRKFSEIQHRKED